jgi:branched-chain amino acid transport system substrate-binding protein
MLNNRKNSVDRDALWEDAMANRFTAFSRATLLIALGAGLAALPLKSAIAEDTIKIGVLEPFTGPWAKNGNESYVAMEIARDMINEKGGIKGKKIVYVRGDAPDPSAGKSEAERIITQEGVKLITGTYASPLGIAISAEAERHGVIHWETIASADIITKRGYKHVFQVGPAASRYGKAAFDFTKDELAKRLGKKFEDLRIALLWENRAFGTAVGKGARARADELGIKLVYDEGYDQFMTDMTPLVQKLKDTKPDILVVISFINDTVLLHRKAKELNFNVPAVIGVSAGHSVPDLKDSLGSAVNGIFVSDLPVLVNPKALLPKVQAASEEFNKRYEKIQHRVPAGHAVASFAALWTLFNDVLPKAKSMDPEDVRAAALSVDLPVGSLINGSGLKFSNFDLPNDPKDSGQNIRSAIGVWQWQDMAARQVYPKDLATNDIIMVPLPEWAKR